MPKLSFLDMVDNNSFQLYCPVNLTNDDFDLNQIRVHVVFESYFLSSASEV